MSGTQSDIRSGGSAMGIAQMHIPMSVWYVYPDVDGLHVEPLTIGVGHVRPVSHHSSLYHPAERLGVHCQIDVLPRGREIGISELLLGRALCLHAYPLSGG